MGDPRGQTHDTDEAGSAGAFRVGLDHLLGVESRIRKDLEAQLQWRAELAFVQAAGNFDDDDLRDHEDESRSELNRLMLRLGEVIHAREILERELLRETPIPPAPTQPREARHASHRKASSPRRDVDRWSTVFWDEGQPKAAQAAVAILQRHANQPVRVRQIVSEILAEGWLRDSVNPRNAVTSALNRLRDDLRTPVDSPQRGFFRWTDQ